VRYLALVIALAACGNREAPRARDAGGLGEDPARRLTVTECETAVDHATALLDADPAGGDLAAQMKSAREDHVAACVKTGTLRDYRCLLGSHDLTDLGRCPMPGAERR
jgi:hypothetical protein